MIRLALILFLLFLACACPVDDISRVSDGRAPAVAAPARGGDDLACGESPCPEPESGGRAAALLSCLRGEAADTGRPVREGSRAGRRGAVLSSLSDSLIIGRAPPADRAGT